MVAFDFDLQGHLGSKLSKSAKNGLVRAITFEKSHLRSPNWTSRCITDRARLGFYMVEFDLDLQGHLGLNNRAKTAQVSKNGLVHAIPFERLNLGPPNFAIRYIMGRSWIGLYMVEFDLDLQGHLGVIKVKIGKKTGLSVQ